MKSNTNFTSFVIETRYQTVNEQYWLPVGYIRLDDKYEIVFDRYTIGSFIVYLYELHRNYDMWETVGGFHQTVPICEYDSRLELNGQIHVTDNGQYWLSFLDRNGENITYLFNKQLSKRITDVFVDVFEPVYRTFDESDPLY